MLADFSRNFAIIALLSGIGFAGETRVLGAQAESGTDSEFAIGDVLPQIQLKTWQGDSFDLPPPEASTYLLIAFVGTECPLVQLYVPKMLQLQAESSEQRLTVIAIDSNSQDSLEELAAFARRSEFHLPLLKDPGSRVANQLGATRTPEFLLFDDERRLRYRGRFDDQYGIGYARDEPSEQSLLNALRSLEQGTEVVDPETEVVGCLIGKPVTEVASESLTQVTYSGRIAEIMNRHCVECHRAGEIAPFPLDNADDVVGWAGMIEEVIRTGRMPPWGAEPSVGDFANERLVTGEEYQLIRDWVNAGTPIGDITSAPPAPTFVEGWQLPRRPDEVIAMSEHPFSVDAEGVIEYQYYVVDPHFTEDKWVSAAQVIPGNPSVVHHAIVFFRAPDAAQADHLGWIGAYVPGQRLEPPVAGLARRVPAGAKLIFQMHYTPVGRATTDITEIGLCFVDEAEVERELVTIPVVQRDFEIPPHASSHVVEADISGLPDGASLLGITPHMHFRGKSFDLTVSNDGGMIGERLLRVPDYDFNWQHVYRFAEPILLSPELHFRTKYEFDNSSANLANPDPSIPVTWGDQTWEEMAVAFFDIALPSGLSAEELFLHGARSQAERHKRLMDEVSQFFARFDRNGDRQIRRTEVPESFATFAFHRYDSNEDDVLTEGEMLKWMLQNDQD